MSNLITSVSSGTSANSNLSQEEINLMLVLLCQVNKTNKKYSKVCDGLITKLDNQSKLSIAASFAEVSPKFHVVTPAIKMYEQPIEHLMIEVDTI